VIGHTRRVPRDHRPAASSLGGVLLALTLAACGPVSGGGSPSSASAGAAGSASTTPDSARFCAVVAEQRAQLAGTELSSLLVGGSPQAWKAYLARTSQLNTELVDAAPPDIKPTVQTLKASDDELAATLAAADYQPQKVGSARLIAVISTPQRRAASATLTAYTRTTCGIDLAATPSS